MSRYPYLIAFVFYCCSTSLSGQDNSLHFRTVDQSNGLSELQITYLTQDSRGFMWFGSYDGLNRFDGKNVRVYRPTLPDGSYSPNISSKVMEDSAGRLWFSTSGGLHAIGPSGNTLKSITLQAPDSAQTFNPEHVLVHVDTRNRLWVIAHNWLHLYDPSTGRDSLLHPLSSFTCYPLVRADGTVSAIVNLLAAEGGGIELIEYKRDGMHSTRWFTGENGSLRALALFACTGGDSLVWLPTDAGLIRFQVNAPEKSRIFHPKGYENSRFFDVAPWGENKLVVTSTAQGYFIFDVKTGQEHFIASGLKIRLPGEINIAELQNLYVGRDQSLGFSIWNKGIFYTMLKPPKFQTYEHPARQNSATSLPVSSIAEDWDGNIWTASDEGGVAVRSGGGSVRFPAELNISPAPNKLFCDREGDLWAFNAQTVWLKRRNESLFKIVASGLNRLFNIRQISAKRFLLVCPDGVFEFDKMESGKDFSNLQPAISNGSVLDVFPDADGRLYVSDEVDKLSVYSIQKKGFLLEQEFYGCGYVSAMSADVENVWFASSKGLVKITRNDHALTFEKADNHALEHSFTSLLADNSGNLWLSSNLGIFKYKHGSSRHYTESDGLQGLQFKLGCSCRLHDGQLAFGGVKGFNVFHPDSIQDNVDPPLVHITSWVVNDTGAVSQDPEFLPKQEFDFQNRTHTFYFVGIDYSGPDEVLYKYRLKGFETDTVNGGLNGFARYAQLPAGTYTLQVWAANSDGVWTTLPLELPFTILPPWYATWWARSLQGLLIACILYAFYRNRIGIIKRKEAERLKEMEYLRNEAESKQLAAELENAVLRLQMNPHFIFNSMNSISSYILQKDMDTANVYINRFAGLMRSILELAPKTVITLADEIELLGQYMQAESMRFPSQFTWRFEVDSTIDPDEVVLPTMILQPFVENAIWHGLSRKKTPGLILISVGNEDGAMRCTIEDNGIGRVARNKEQNHSHQSKALEITRQRLIHIHKGREIPNALEIIDLYNDAGMAAGTRVIIRLWLEQNLFE